VLHKRLVLGNSEFSKPARAYEVGETETSERPNNSNRHASGRRDDPDVCKLHNKPTRMLATLH